jgi:hypothetical protein
VGVPEVEGGTWTTVTGPVAAGARFFPQETQKAALKAKMTKTIFGETHFMDYLPKEISKRIP